MFEKNPGQENVYVCIYEYTHICIYVYIIPSLVVKVFEVTYKNV